jgi:hypothetical protein
VADTHRTLAKFARRDLDRFGEDNEYDMWENVIGESNNFFFLQRKTSQRFDLDQY